MKAASVNELKKELLAQDESVLQELCLRLIKYKKENKELLTYLLFEAHHEPAYIESVKEELNEMFAELPASNLYLSKKVLRKIVRFANKQIKYSGIKLTELELRIYFCVKVKETRIPLQTGTVLFNLYQQQLKKIDAVLKKLPEDIQGDYERDIAKLWMNTLMQSQPNNPLHGKTLEMILNELVDKYGWEELADRIPVNCFISNLSIKSSLTFFRKTPWARKKVEDLYVESLEQ